MNNKQIKEIFLKNGLGEIKIVEKIEIGFCNKVYSIDDKYILKVCEDIANERYFAREVFLFNFLKKELPVPKIIVYDESKKIYDKQYMIYHKIQGDNLYSKWHLLTNDERRNIIRQLCDVLKKMNNVSYKEYAGKFSKNEKVDWQKIIISRIKKSLKKVKDRKLISPDFIKAIQNFTRDNRDVLKKQKLALVYFDAHFDNVLIKDKQMVGLLDLERTEIASIDFTLDIIKRMVDIPHKYMSEESEKYCKPEDYANLLEWFKEFYPELFNFEDIDKRLALYAVEHDLKDLLLWPDIDNIKRTIAKNIGYKIT